jgi:tRNA(fMet)-specific endonuclease VapC
MARSVFCSHALTAIKTVSLRVEAYQVVDALILETTVLVDLEREARRGPGRATRFLAEHPQALLYVTPTIAGELAAGPSIADRERWETLLSGFITLPITPDVSWEYGRAYRYLRDNDQLIGANDLWIAATAIAHALPLVTRNEREFRRVPGLNVLTLAS